MDLGFPKNYRVKVKENEKIYKYLELARELKKLWIMKMAVLLIIIGSQRTVFKDLEKRSVELEIRVRIEIIRTTGMLRST